MIKRVSSRYLKKTRYKTSFKNEKRPDFSDLFTEIRSQTRIASFIDLLNKLKSIFNRQGLGPRITWL